MLSYDGAHAEPREHEALTDPDEGTNVSVGLLTQSPTRSSEASESHTTKRVTRLRSIRASTMEAPPNQRSYEDALLFEGRHGCTAPAPTPRSSSSRGGAVAALRTVRRAAIRAGLWFWRS